MKTFYKIMSFLTAFFFTLNCACFAEENSKFSQDNIFSLSDQNNKNFNKPYDKILKNKEPKMQTKKIINILKSVGIPFVKHIFSAIIDYTVASIIGNIIEIKIKHKDNPQNTFWLLRDPCCQC